MIVETDLKRIKALFKLTDKQAAAAFLSGKDLAVTAGAGCGKTTTLAVRYLTLLLEGSEPQNVIAVTFTEKAAREMRQRVVDYLVTLAADGEVSESTRRRCRELMSQIDAARIGTIHGLCKQALTLHPAEAGLDPRYEIASEGVSAVLKAQAVETALAQAIQAREQPEMSALLSALSVKAVRELLAALLWQRLDADAVWEQPHAWQATLLTALRRIMAGDEFQGIADELPGLIAAQQVAKPSAGAAPAIEAQARNLSRCWAQARQACDAGLVLEVCAWLHSSSLFLGRRQYRAMTEAFDALVQAYKALYGADLKSLVGECKAGDLRGNCPSDGLDADAAFEQICGRLHEEAAVYAQALAGLKRAYGWALEAYRGALRQMNALDFDDLEDRAARLLAESPSVRAFWQAQAAAVLVDEFQDTNQRQRRIIEALCPKAEPGQAGGKLFVVGDARQSIYRFRGADVSVFRQLAADIIGQRNGECIDLDENFRTHAGLLRGIDDLLVPVMGLDGAPDDLHAVPYTLLDPQAAPPQNASIDEAFIEVILAKAAESPPQAQGELQTGEQPEAPGTTGEPADDGGDSESLRALAAAALAQRLAEMKAAGLIGRWKDVALLFRASGGFAPYERALRQAGIPYITAAGLGFYERPEIRDALNIVRALLHP